MSGKEGPAFRFDDPDFIAAYHEGVPRYMPGYGAMQQMATQLLAERAAAEADILVVGAGGGAELKAFALRQAGWRFVGVDPSPQMLAIAASTVGPDDMGRVRLIEGTIERAPPGPFDGASCLLTLHFVPDDGAKLATLREIRQRLRAGAALVIADHCLDPADARFERGLSRYEAFAVASGAPPEQAAEARAAIAADISMISPAREEALLAEAGFTDVELFYAGLGWRGWVAQAG